jgi:hypothetical protein
MAPPAARSATRLQNRRNGDARQATHAAPELGEAADEHHVRAVRSAPHPPARQHQTPDPERDVEPGAGAVKQHVGEDPEHQSDREDRNGATRHRGLPGKDAANVKYFAM